MKIKILGYDFEIKKHRKIKAPVSYGVRRTGTSTRLVDGYIQTLFNIGEVVIKDHHGSRDSDRHLFDRVLKRLKAEHDLDDKKYLRLSKPHCKIQLNLPE